ncbi:midasin-like isoform X3 [Punica granatum]|uniref:Midasin-like isoform X3 n=1 Tax=Punica granatum TaxID=22663 RepID=A0A6P8E8H0_PUNGR|nr:midasin-like isoform X3 [Punica granatum]
MSANEFMKSRKGVGNEKGNCKDLGCSSFSGKDSSLTGLRIGRVTFQHSRTALPNERKPFMEIRGALHAIEKIACSVKYKEPVLFFGETGTGKTTLVQNLAFRLCQKLTVSNLSQQSDVPDFFFGVSGKCQLHGFACKSI